MEERRAKVRQGEPENGIRAAGGRYSFSDDSVSLPLTRAAAATPTVGSNGASGARLVTIGDFTLNLPEAPSGPPSPLYEYSKQVTDVLAAAVILLALAPLFFLVALLVYLEDQGPIFYHQERVGRDGRRFRFYKFRSMVQNADAVKAQLMAQNEASGPIFKMKHDPRVTRVGRVLRRYSLDELPQLINVVRGEMSLVGPRPHLPREVDLYTERQKERLTVPPGLLCFREVTGRSNMTFEQWMELDLLYIQYRSFQTDMRILMRTIPAVLKGEGAY
jgi:lipopolysaccharide/colanic/teichoic acid biosynthesis glycosyltransferase